MLTISPIRSISYYTDLAKEDYYLDGGEPNGEWTGAGTRLLGLSGTVETKDYLNIMKGLTPDGQYSLRQQSSLKQRAGWDLTFSAPKSVSIAWARADKVLKLRIQTAHKQAVIKAVEKLEQHASYTRIGKNGTQQECTIGLIAGLFEHATSREQDPQLHAAPSHESRGHRLGPGEWLEGQDLPPQAHPVRSVLPEKLEPVARFEDPAAHPPLSKEASSNPE